MNRRYGKWIFYEGRWIPVFAGGVPDGEGEGDKAGEGNKTQDKEGQNQQEPKVNPDEIVAQKLKELGFNSIDEIRKLKAEYEKLTKQSQEKNKSLEEKLNQLEKLYKTEKVRAEVLKTANQIGAIDPEDIFIYAKDKAVITEEGKILIEDKTVEDFLKQLKEKKPHWFKADDKEGSGTSNVKEPKKELSPQEKLAKIFQLKK